MTDTPNPQGVTMDKLVERLNDLATEMAQEDRWGISNLAREAASALQSERSSMEGEKPCVFCPDWTAWERDLKRAAVKDEQPISDEDLDRFRYALADVHCKSSSAQRHEVEYRLQRFGAKMWRQILARLDQAEAALNRSNP